MMRVELLRSLAVIAVGVLATIVHAQTAGVPANSATAPPSAPSRKLQIANKPWTGDFDKMLERRMIRIYAPFSRSLYHSDKGRERGIAVELARDWERYIDVKHAKQLGKPLTVHVAPATRDKLLPFVDEGLADVAIGNLTVTDERLRLVDFIPGDEGRRTINEVVVTGPASPELKSLSDLSGKKVHVRKASSYYESLAAQNDTLRREGARSGWAIRKDSPKLKTEIADFFQNWALKNGVADYRMSSYMKRVKELRDPTGSAEWKRFNATLAIFEKYGQQYGFDPLMLAAQGYQESQLNQNAKSSVGAIGVMQLMPATGAELGVGDIHVTEPNIHGGAKYMDQLMTRYFPDARFSEGNRPLFAFASYNCGPGNVSTVRKEAAKRGLDPDKWFNNVEIVVAEKIGTETTTYVRNIYKYYVAYRLALDARSQVEAARRQVAPIAK